MDTVFDRKAYYEEYNKTDKVKQQRRDYYQRNREAIRSRSAVYRSTPEYREHFREYAREWRRKNADRCAIAARKVNDKLRKDAIAAYGGKCVCCNLSEHEFLTFDHKNGGGTLHRKYDNGARSNICRWLRDNDYPREFQLLCMNCNWARGKYGYCPHERDRCLP